MAVTATTWADGFGTWHARITEQGVGIEREAQALAHRAISEELTARGLNPEGLGVRLVQLGRDDAGTVTSEYAETWPTDEDEEG